MFVNEDLNNSKSTNIKLNFPLYYSPYIHKKKRKEIYTPNPGKSRWKRVRRIQEIK